MPSAPGREHRAAIKNGQVDKLMPGLMQDAPLPIP